MKGPYDGQRVTYTFGVRGRYDEARQRDITSMSLRGAIAGFRAGTLYPEKLADTDGFIPVLAPTRASTYAPVEWVEVARIPPEAPGEDDPMALLRGLPLTPEASDAGTGIALLGETGALTRSSRTELRDMDRGLAEQLASLEKLRNELMSKRRALEAEIKKRREQVWLIELFLGSSEEVTVLRDGAPAAASTPITVRQQVLCMDEEIAVYEGLQDPEKIGTFDVLRLADFDAWVCRPEALAEVCPWEKGIVGLRVRRRERNRDNPDRDFAVAMQNAEMAESDRITFLLVRNGERLYRIGLDVNLWPRLFPSEADAHIGDRFGDEARMQARMKPLVGGLLAIQGILERSELLHPLPRRISVFNPADADAFCLMRDGEAHAAIAASADDAVHLAWGNLYAMDPNGYASHVIREGYHRWLKSQVRPGMRVMWMAKVRAYNGHNRDDWFGSLEHRTGIKRLSDPPEFGEVYTLDADTEHQSGSFSYSFSYLPTDPVFSPDPMYRGCTIERPRTRRVRFCCFAGEVYPVDLISWRVLEGLIRSREQRANNEDMLHLAFRFWRFAKQEAARERPFIDLVLRQAGLDPQDPSTEDERARAERLLRWWKVKTKENRSLGADEPKALRMILGAYKRGEDADNDPERAFLQAWRRR